MYKPNKLIRFLEEEIEVNRQIRNNKKTTNNVRTFLRDEQVLRFKESNKYQKNLYDTYLGIIWRNS